MKIIPDVVAQETMLSMLKGVNARAAAGEMLARKLSSVVVVDETGKLIGIVTDRDLTKALVVGGQPMETTTLGNLMTPDPDVLRADDHPRDALELMELRGYRHLPVIDDDGRAIAVVTILDLYDAITRLNQDLMAKTQQYLFGERYNPDI